MMSLSAFHTWTNVCGPEFVEVFALNISASRLSGRRAMPGESTSFALYSPRAYASFSHQNGKGAWHGNAAQQNRPNEGFRRAEYCLPVVRVFYSSG
jgi:hypothetical protein